MISTIAMELSDLKTKSTLNAETQCATDVEAMFMGNMISNTLFTQKGWIKLLEGAAFEIVSADTDFFVAPTKDAFKEPRYHVVARKPEVI